MHKNAILCFGSFHPSNMNNFQHNIREKNYEIALTWLLNSLPENWDIFYNENTLYNLNELQSENLKQQLSSKRVMLMLHNNNIGNINKGAGEHDMCKKCFNEIDYMKYNWIVYFTARHIIPNSWYFDKLSNDWNSYDAVMSNPDFYYLDYTRETSIINIYNDMLFSMKANTFFQFVSSIDVDRLRSLHKSSESDLYDFIQNNDINKIEVEHLGILRNDHQSRGWHLV